MAGSVPERDAFLAERLRKAGAILLGKANMSEWANIRSTHSSSGWSARGGQARNPYALDRNPCGSSSGSAAAVAANLAPLAIGTETDGSIVCPSSANGIVGIKPTLGLVSRAGVIPIAHSQDTAGPMARTVRDAAVLLSFLTGADPRDPATAASAGHVQADYASFCDKDGLRGARIGVARKFFGRDARVDAIVESALAAMKAAGAVLVDPVDLSPGREYEETELEVLLYELKADLNSYLAATPKAPVRTLADVIRFNEEHREAEMPYFGQELFLQAQEKGGLDTPAYRKALASNQRLSRAEGIDAALRKHRVDALVAPTGGPAWLTDLVNGDHFTGVSSSTPPAVAGYPAVTVPAGFVRGLPIGITFMGGAWSEPALIKLAYAYEQQTRHRTAPRLLPSVPLA
jgi:amidase